MQASPVVLVRLALISLVGAAILESGTARSESPAAAGRAATAGCPRDDSGLKLPPGFCATVFADDTGHARHLVVSPDGVVYVNTWSGRYYARGGKAESPDRGFLVALKDTQGTGKADVNQRFGETLNSGGAGGTGIALFDGFLYVESHDKIVRYKMLHGSRGHK